MAKARATSKVIKDFDPKKIEELKRRFAGPVTVNVGFPEGGDVHEGSAMNVASIALVHEFGSESRNIPERSFLRAGIRRNAAAYLRLNKTTLRKVLAGEMTMRDALGLLGEKAKSDVQMEITNGEFAPLSDSTINAKGSSKPLIDSGQMRQSVAWEYGDD